MSPATPNPRARSRVRPEYSLENEFLRLTLSPAENTWRLDDFRGRVTWGNFAVPGPWVVVHSRAGTELRRRPVMLRSIEESEEALACRFVHLEGGRAGEAKPAVRLGGDAGFALVFRIREESVVLYVVADEGVTLPPLELLGCGLELFPGESGEMLLPVRSGLLIPAAGKTSFESTFGTYEYEGLHQSMIGLFKSGAALMARWADPYLSVTVGRAVETGSSRLGISFILRNSARSLELQCLGTADIAALATAYRMSAGRRGLRVGWDRTLEIRPQAKRLFGACNVKLWHALARTVGEDLEEKSVVVNWTFDEAARVAEHLANDLKLTDVLFHLGGWTRYGYDCRHPDIMPANPECGGTKGLADCVRRVQACGYLFCLHDNYQDIYRDAPSWDEAYVEKRADGSLTEGGLWLGGRAYLTCSQEALRLARRPQNLPLVKETVNPDAYFIDTTFAAGPQECADPRHPLTRHDDIRWKTALADYARGLFGLFGSECGREWAIGHADFFEGLCSVAGRYFHTLDPDALDATVVPFFDMVFHDCVVAWGKYGYDPRQMAGQVAFHVLTGRALYYHSLGAHLYWQEAGAQAELPAVEGPADPGLYTRGHNGWAEGMCLWDRFMKNTHEVLGPLAKLTAQSCIEGFAFLDPQRGIRQTVFGNGVCATANFSDGDFTIESATGGNVVLPPMGFLVESDPYVAFAAKSWNGETYDGPALFTIASLDGKPLRESGKVRVYHGFGPSSLKWKNAPLDVKREAFV